MLILMEYLFLFKHKLSEMFNLTRHFVFYLFVADAKLSALDIFIYSEYSIFMSMYLLRKLLLRNLFHK